LAGLTILLSGTAVRAQIAGDVMGMHNLGRQQFANHRRPPDACAYCHAPHSGLNRGLWNRS